MTPTTGQTVLPARYTLYGVLYHHGTSASGGHYTVDVFHPNAHGHGGSEGEGTWLRIDDESVSAVRHEDVFGTHENADGRCAYLLFYRRTTTCTQT
jgi:ubiquitin carboxyl-terminal hydrolase 10